VNFVNRWSDIKESRKDDVILKTIIKEINKFDLESDGTRVIVNSKVFEDNLILKLAVLPLGIFRSSVVRRVR